MCVNKRSVGSGLSHVAECRKVAPIINCKKIVAVAAVQRYLSGRPARSSSSGLFAIQFREVKTARLTVVQKKSWASVAWAAETARGRLSFTVNPPSKPCAITANKATKPNRRTQRRFSFRNRKTTKPIVNKPTLVATTRWPCSQKRLPTIFGNT